VVAEGIERPEQLELLQEMGCGLGQGYLIAKPMDAHGIEALVGGGWPGAEATAQGRENGDDAGGAAGLGAGPESEFVPDPGPASDPALNPGEAPAPAAPAAAPAK
jgi:EAL domain